MSVALNYTQIFAGNESLPVAPSILSALTPASFESFLSGAGFSTPTTPGSTGLYGGKIAFGTPKNFTVRKYIQFSLMTAQYSNVTGLATVANGGIRIYFYDASGNYAGWSVYGSGITGYDADSGDGWMSTYRPPTDPTYSQEWIINRLRTPDYSSGSIDWTAVTGCEIHLNVIGASMFASWGNSLYLRWLGLMDPHVGTGATSLLEFYNMVFAGGQYGAEWQWRRNFVRVGYQHYGLAGVSFSPKADFRIGDGSTPTTLSESKFAVGFWNLHEDGAQALGPQILLDATKDRAIVINQSAADSITFTDGTWSSSSGWSISVIGSSAGLCSFVRNSFVKAEYLTLAHSIVTDCIFDSCKRVAITALTDMTNATIRNGNGEGLRFTGAPGNYSGITVNFQAGTGYDLLIDPTGPGTFNFSGVTVDPAYTVKVRNLSATHAITVQLPTGTLYSASTVGGSITIDAPAIVATASVIGMTAGSRLQVFNVTTNTEIVNAVQAGTSWSLEYANGSTFSAGDIVRIRCTYQNGATAKIGEEYTAIPSTAGFTQLISPVNDEVYNLYGVDGSTCTEFAWDGGNLQVDINDADNTTVVQRIGAWYSYYITTATGINALFGGILWDQINAVKIVSSVVNIQLDNLKTTPLLLKGGRIYRTDGLTVIAPASNSIQLDYDPVYMVETGVSGLTAGESALLTTAGGYTEKLNQIKQNTDLIPAAL